MFEKTLFLSGFFLPTTSDPILSRSSQLSIYLWTKDHSVREGVISDPFDFTPTLLDEILVEETRIRFIQKIRRGGGERVAYSLSLSINPFSFVESFSGGFLFCDHGYSGRVSGLCFRNLPDEFFQLGYQLAPR